LRPARARRRALALDEQVRHGTLGREFELVARRAVRTRIDANPHQALIARRVALLALVADDALDRPAHETRRAVHDPGAALEFEPPDALDAVARDDADVA